MNIAVVRGIGTSLIAALIGGSMVAPVVSATSTSSRATDLLRGSATAMTRPLHQVHVTGYDMRAHGQKLYRLRVEGDCIMQPQTLRSSFQVWGTRALAGSSPAAYDTHDIVYYSTPPSGQPYSATWERDALKANRWHRNDSLENSEAAQIISLCIASPLFINLLMTIPPTSMTRIDSTNTAGFKPWHFRSAQRTGKGRASKTLYTDFYIDQTTHYLVRIRGENDDDRSYQVRTYSRFNIPVRIQAPV